ncbi:hypothetical protein DSECCO2_662030 [anaerobic digester metagenome]
MTGQTLQFNGQMLQYMTCPCPPFNPFEKSAAVSWRTGMVDEAGHYSLHAVQEAGHGIRWFIFQFFQIDFHKNHGVAAVIIGAAKSPDLK